MKKHTHPAGPAGKRGGNKVVGTLELYVGNRRYVSIEFRALHDDLPYDSANISIIVPLSQARRLQRCLAVSIAAIESVNDAAAAIEAQK